MGTVYTYKSTDASSPVDTGTAGDLVNVWDKCLVSGYGSQSGAGWTKPFTGTNSADFRQGSSGTSLTYQYYVELNDNGPGAGTGKEGRVRGYESMSAFNTGSNLFPTAAQLTNGVFVRKSTSADTVPRPWILVGDNRTFYFFSSTGDIIGSWMAFAFGDIYSFKGATDLGSCLIIGRITENSGSMSAEELANLVHVGTTLGSHFLARDASNNVGAIQASKLGDWGVNNGGSALFGNIQRSNYADHRDYLAPLRIGHTTGGNTIRGRMRGLWQFCHPIASIQDGDIITGKDDLNGKTFMVIKAGGVGSTAVYLVETSSTWDTN